MRFVLTMALVGAAGCKKQVVDTGPKMPVGITHPDLDCPPGTIGMGAAPPTGTEVYCARVDPYTNTVTRQGPSITWHSGTRRASTGAYNENRKNGQWTYWSPRGTLEQQGSYTADRKDGLWTTFHVNGEKASEGNYVSDREEGNWTFWGEDGLSYSRGEYRYGGRIGKWIDYDADGNALRERTYRNGSIVTQRELTGGK
jgi:hypothetical protein